MQYKCSTCQQNKFESEFHRSKSIKRGFAYSCKDCQNAMSKEQREKRKVNGPSIVRKSKVCAKCWSLKPVSQFSKNRNAADHLTSYCKPCFLAYVKVAQAKAKRKNL